MRFLRLQRWMVFVLFLTAALTPALAANDSFVVQNMKVQGLQRISTGTVFTYLPISVGDRVNSQRIASAIKALYHTGFFSNIQMRRSGHTLIIKVRERPSIAHFKIVGNKKIKTKDLTKGLKKAGLARGRIFSHSVMKKVKQQLTRLYLGHAKYNAKIDVLVKAIGNNRVDVTIKISEGVDTRIQSINIVGNKTFSDDTLLENFKLQPTLWYSWLQSSDRYVRETLSGDLETLRSYYMDRGYADFRINSVQVTISPNYKHIYITINVHEGQVYKIRKVGLSGRFIVPKAQLQKLIQTHSGETFSMGVAQHSADLMANLLGSKGYAFAKIQPVPKLDRKTHQVDLTYYVKPGSRTYVRHISFSGMPDTDDVVFRREMRQLEGGWLSNTALKRSKFRLGRLPFVKHVKESTNPVPGSPDQVDLDYKLTPRQAGQFIFGVGYSPNFGFGINASIAHNNFLGEGDTISVGIQKNQINKSFSAGWVDPYATVNGVSRSIRVYYNDGEALLRNASPLHIKDYGAGLTYGIPMSEFDTVFLGASASHNELVTSIYGSSFAYLKFALNPLNGSTYKTPIGPAVRYQEYQLHAGWSHDSLNKMMFATKGNKQAIRLTAALPFSDVKYYQVTFSSVDFVSLGGGFLYLFNGHVGLNKTYSNSPAVPPTEYFFVGGPTSVRGFQSGYLGPLDRSGNPLGGNFEVYAQNELILPPLFGVGGAQSSSARFSLFFDFGRAFAEPEDFSAKKLYRSAGISAQFLTPMGLMRVSLGWPLNHVTNDDVRQLFQFTVGRHF